MNKKIILIISATVAAIVVISIAIVLISSGIQGERPEDINSSDISSIVSSDASVTDSIGHNSSPLVPDTLSDATIEKGNMGIESVETEVGKTVDVPVVINDNPGIVAGQFVFEYDSSVLTYVEYAEGDIFDEYDVNEADGKLKCVISASDVTKDVKTNGKLIVLRFNIKENAAPGEYIVKTGDDTMLCNSDEVIVSPEISYGKIIVK